MTTRQEIEATVLRLWAEGQSAREIGMTVTLTRNAVIGIVHRAKYKGVDVDPQGRHRADGGWAFSKKERTDKRERRVRPPPSKPKTVAVPLAVLQKEKKKPKKPSSRFRPDVRIYETEHVSCRFPTGVSPKHEHLFCNAPIHKGSYCSDHYSRVWQKVQR